MLQGGAPLLANLVYNYIIQLGFIYGYWSKPRYLVNPKIAGKWMFIHVHPTKNVSTGIDPCPYNYS